MKAKIEIINSSSFKLLPIKKVASLIAKVLEDFKFEEYSLNIIYFDNSQIQELNKKFLNHDYPTDVISFNIDDNPLIAEIYIGVEIAKLQANEFKVSLRNEILRLAVHGCLHICGYNDKTVDEKTIMSSLEDKYLEYARKNS
ncbi:rRNA maturation RNase YbeY [Candidatus Kapabacteria bacterium]|nr:rRNA maturation RNase YbeY [Candidatus Kapabacteria bacterium]